MNIYDYLDPKSLKCGEYLILERNNFLAMEKDICNEIFIVIDGKIKISSYQQNGNEDIYNIIKKGEMFANILIFSPHNYYLGNVCALTKTIVLKITRFNLLDLLKTNDAFLNYFLACSALEALDTKIQLKMLTKPLEDRFLYYLSLHNNEIEKSIQELATILFVQRETLSRLISSLTKKNIIKRINKRIILLKNF